MVLLFSARSLDRASISLALSRITWVMLFHTIDWSSVTLRAVLSWEMRLSVYSTAVLVLVAAEDFFEAAEETDGSTRNTVDRNATITATRVTGKAIWRALLSMIFLLWG